MGTEVNNHLTPPNTCTGIEWMAHDGSGNLHSSKGGRLEWRLSVDLGGYAVICTGRLVLVLAVLGERA